MAWDYVRTLDTYPTGGRRRRILAAAVLACLICSYEGAIAPIVPLLRDDLGMSLTTYGAVSAVAAVMGAISGLIGGKFTDTVGRVRLLIPLMMVCAFLCFATALVNNPTEFFVARMVLSFADGMALATTAPLVRDFSPRMGRATAFSFWTWGPVGANFLAAFIAGITLTAFNNAWQSQMIIQGCISLVVSIAVMMTVADLSPELRASVQHSEQASLGKSVTDEPPRAATLFRRPQMWAHMIGIALWLIIYMTLSLYGQTLLVDTFGYSAARASQMMMLYWVCNIGTLVLAGWISDRLQLRRVFSLCGTFVAMIGCAWLAVVMATPDSASIGAVAASGLLVGVGLAVGYAPWMANYSENTEDIDARLQGLAWGMFSFITRGIGVVVLVAAPLVVDAGSWRSWILVSIGGLVAFLVASFFFEGPVLRRPGVEVPEQRAAGVPDAAVVSAEGGTPAPDQMAPRAPIQD
ncbi:MFS transporter [Nocardioides insulae]|uniref:MFS transporter n=1 Tax=Nocardioides insulae TaxID=394734 RepID=UPI0003F4DCE6|nr:MFS transporter [Nocardioides insulae]